MKAYLFSWNSSDPDNWNHEEAYEEWLHEGPYEVYWRTSRKNMELGDKAYLIKLGPHPRGVIGSGTVMDVPEKNDPSDTVYRVKIWFHRFLDFQNGEVIPQEKLVEITTQMGLNQNWSPQASGNEIKPELIPVLDHYFDLTSEKLKLELNSSTVLIEEGESREIQLTRYERSPEARQGCLNYHGYDCSVCDMNFEKQYGEIGKKFIHVHHLVPLASIGEKYLLDYIKDLRPVCPNCHAMLHKADPPISIETLRRRIEK